MTTSPRRLLGPLVAAIVAGGIVVAAALAMGSSSSSSSSSSTTTADSGAVTPGLALQDAIVKVVQSVSPSVVQIQDQVGLGSGIVLDAAGYIVTNNHVVTGAKSLTVTTSNGSQYPAELVGTFPSDDLAVIKISGADLEAATFADSSKLNVGDLAIAIGNPLGLRSSVTDGIVSAFRQDVSEGSNGVTLPSVIQTSAAINPGNSGGALVDIQGRVIGIPTLAATDPELGGSAPGIGFAIPGNLAKDIARQIVTNGKVVNYQRAYLGFKVGETGGLGLGGWPCRERRDRCRRRDRLGRRPRDVDHQRPVVGTGRAEAGPAGLRRGQEPGRSQGDLAGNARNIPRKLRREIYDDHPVSQPRQRAIHSRARSARFTHLRVLRGDSHPERSGIERSYRDQQRDRAGESRTCDREQLELGGVRSHAARRDHVDDSYDSSGSSGSDDPDEFYERFGQLGSAEGELHEVEGDLCGILGRPRRLLPDLAGARADWNPGDLQHRGQGQVLDVVRTGPGGQRVHPLQGLPGQCIHGLGQGRRHASDPADQEPDAEDELHEDPIHGRAGPFVRGMDRRSADRLQRLAMCAAPPGEVQQADVHEGICDDLGRSQGHDQRCLLVSDRDQSGEQRERSVRNRHKRGASVPPIDQRCIFRGRLATGHLDRGAVSRE